MVGWGGGQVEGVVVVFHSKISVPHQRKFPFFPLQNFKLFHPVFHFKISIFSLKVVLRDFVFHSKNSHPSLPEFGSPLKPLEESKFYFHPFSTPKFTFSTPILTFPHSITTVSTPPTTIRHTHTPLFPFNTDIFHSQISFFHSTAPLPHSENSVSLQKKFLR